MTAYEYDDQTELLATHKRHLMALLKQQAAMGAQTPAHVLLAIEDYEQAIVRLTNEPVEMTVREKHLIDQQFQMRIEGDLFKLDRKIEQLAALLDTLLLDLARRGLTMPARKRPIASRRVNGG